MTTINRLRQSAAALRLRRFFFLRGSRGPDSRWYGGYKLSELLRAMKAPFSPDNLPLGYGRWIDERIVEYPWLFSRLPDGPGTLLDAGSVLNHLFVLAHPKLQTKEVTIMTLAPEECCHWQRRISYVYGDARNMIFRDEVFDNVVSLSTLEHVGLDNQCFHASPLSQTASAPDSHLAAVQEFRRVLKRGGRCFVSVPFGRRVSLGWQQVFDGEMIERVIRAFAPESCKEKYFQYSEPRRWMRCEKSEAADARYFNFQTDKPWPGHPAAAGAIACLELQK